MAATAQPRSGRHTRRRTRHDTPAWAEKYPDTPEGQDAMQAEGEARRLPGDTDPDTIDDPDVRDAFLRLSEADEPGSEPPAARAPAVATAAPRGKRPAAAAGGRAARARRSNSVPTPTLRPPARLSASDGTGFMLGLVLYAVGLNYLRYGWPGVTGWLSAKFINEPVRLANVDLSAPAPFGKSATGGFNGGNTF